MVLCNGVRGCFLKNTNISTARLALLEQKLKQQIRERYQFVETRCSKLRHMTQGGGCWGFSRKRRPNGLEIRKEKLNLRSSGTQEQETFWKSFHVKSRCNHSGMDACEPFPFEGAGARHDQRITLIFFEVRIFRACTIFEVLTDQIWYDSARKLQRQIQAPFLSACGLEALLVAKFRSVKKPRKPTDAFRASSKPVTHSCKQSKFTKHSDSSHFQHAQLTAGLVF